MKRKKEYILWRIQIKTHFRIHKIFQFIANELSENPTYMTEKKMYLILPQINQGVEMSIFHLIYKPKSAKEACIMLENAYWHKNQIYQNKILLIKKNFEYVGNLDNFNFYPNYRTVLLFPLI